MAARRDIWYMKLCIYKYIYIHVLYVQTQTIYQKDPIDFES